MYVSDPKEGISDLNTTTDRVNFYRDEQLDSSTTWYEAELIVGLVGGEAGNGAAPEIEFQPK